MKKYLMSLSLFIFCATSYGETIDLGEKSIYSETGFKNSLRSSTTSPFILKSKDIEGKGYTSVSEVLDSIPGVNVKEGAHPAIDLRGQGFQKAKATVQLLVDGIPANMLDTSHQNVPINVVNIDEIERIEVIPGGGAVLYGSGTSGGVINIITKKYKNKNIRGGVGYQISSFRNNKFDVSTGTSVGNFDFDVNYSKNRKYGYRDYDFTNSDYFSGRINYNINKTDNIAFKYSGYRSKYTYPASLTETQLDRDRRQSGLGSDDKNDNNKIKKDEFSLTYNSKITNNNDLNVVAFYQKTEIPSESISDGTGMYKGILAGQVAGLSSALRNPSLPTSARLAMTNRLNALITQLRNPSRVDFSSHSNFEDRKISIKAKDKYTYDNSGSNIIIGLGYTDDNMIRASKMELVGKMKLVDTHMDLTKKTFESFALNTYKVNNFEFIQGLRYERSKFDGSRRNLDDVSTVKRDMNNWAGTLAVNHLYSDTGNVYLKYERAFTSPSPSQLSDKVRTSSGAFDYVTNNLKSEKTNQFEVGWNDYLLGSLLSADIYYSETKDEIATIFDGGRAHPTNGFKTTNLGKTRRYGFDLSAEQKLENFTFKESYSFVKTKILKDNDKNIEGKEIAEVPNHKLLLSVDYNISSKFTVGAEYEYKAAAFVDNANKYGKDKAKSVFNLRANYQVNDSLDIYAGVDNVFGAKYYNSVTLSSGDRLYDPAPRTTYYTGFKYKF
ncbi:TonB-dependent receptor [Fusobacterium pseudoperiodonticum]|uniref:Hemin receptor n=1 Tax=Fusobacterium pseudoperiodonticum TaxID=2663009 RepID=A0AAD0F1L8_9FUSO|nr:TonB-dependent receptor [Fusobacterium pseudoperiodonticum]ATV35270.1 hemin receptor [Fusobacterium pseudoperiodonticum]ATV61835.1 hemin receptor [Fusobacterium pseudoperiodonticum]